jgi:hypothetical protein
MSEVSQNFDWYKTILIFHDKETNLTRRSYQKWDAFMERKGVPLFQKCARNTIIFVLTNFVF